VKAVWEAIRSKAQKELFEFETQTNTKAKQKK
jgi:hypothetical protein